MAVAEKKLQSSTETSDAGFFQSEEKKIIEYVPEFDIYSDSGAIYLEGNMPGVDREGVKISVEKDVLTISGEQKVSIPEHMDQLYSEFNKVFYKKNFRLETALDTDAAEAVMKNGVLRVKMPFKKSVVKNILVKAE